MSVLDRLARNQVLFREVNERLLELSEGPRVESMDFLCECSREECVETIQLSFAEYERVRAHPTSFVIAPGHETPEVEKIVDSNGRYTVVQKTNGGSFAIESDPRSRDGRGE
jgi:hypothetical protein